MTILRRAAVAAVFAVAPLCFAPAFAAEMGHDAMGDDAMGDAMHPMMHSEITCSAAGMSDAGGMMVEFHNMGSEAIPAGSTAHWMLRGVAQGEVHFMDAVAPGGMKMQNYAADEMVHMSGHAPCTAEMMQ